MTRSLLLLALVLPACKSSSPCADGQRFAENVRGGAKIEYCVRKDDGRAQGRYSCALDKDRGAVLGEFDANFKHGKWHFSIGGKPVRIERWHNDVLKEVTVLGEVSEEPLECDGHVIAPHPQVAGDE